MRPSPRRCGRHPSPAAAGEGRMRPSPRRRRGEDEAPHPVAAATPLSRLRQATGRRGPSPALQARETASLTPSLRRHPSPAAAGEGKERPPHPVAGEGGGGPHRVAGEGRIGPHRAIAAPFAVGARYAVPATRRHIAGRCITSRFDEGDPMGRPLHERFVAFSLRATVRPLQLGLLVKRPLG